MCIWSAFAGPRAAEQAHRMLTRSYGIWGGYYTGMVSNDRGRLHCGKTAGDNGEWNRRFDVADFSGDCALFHSRTPSRDDGNWAHPFGTERVRLCAQGCVGVLRDSVPEYCRMAAELAAAGYEFPSATEREHDPVEIPRLPDGRYIHSDEVVALMTDFEYRKTGDPREALRRGCGRAPIEEVFVAVFSDFPGRIFVANVNQHVVVSRENGGVALSTTRMSFGDPAAGDIMTLPCNTLAEVGADGITLSEFMPGFSIDRRTPEYFRERAVAWWRGRQDIHISAFWSEFLDRIWPQNPDSAPDTRAVVAYEVLDGLLGSGRVVQRIVPDRGWLAPEPCSRAVLSWRE